MGQRRASHGPQCPSHSLSGRQALCLVRPETVVRWLRQGFRAFWTWKSHRGRVGRPLVSSEIADLVRTMALANPLWGAPRIHGELLKLGLDVSQRSVARLMPRRPKPPSQMWRTFLRNHLADLVSVDFFVVPTATFRVLYVFVVLLHHRRQVVHFNVTDSPTAAWTAQQVVEAFPDDSAPRYLLRDRDGIYGGEFRRRVKGMLIAEVLTAPRSPWQNPFVERVIGTIRRELFDHVIVLNEGHLRRRLHSYLRYYHGSRTHLALEKDAPEPPAEPKLAAFLLHEGGSEANDHAEGPDNLRKLEAESGGRCRIRTCDPCRVKGTGWAFAPDSTEYHPALFA